MNKTKVAVTYKMQKDEEEVVRYIELYANIDEEHWLSKLNTAMKGIAELAGFDNVAILRVEDVIEW